MEAFALTVAVVAIMVAIDWRAYKAGKEYMKRFICPHIVARINVGVLTKLNCQCARCVRERK